MPLVHGVGDEVVYAALAAAATPLAIALSPAFLKRRSIPSVVLDCSLSRTLRVLWSRLRLWLLRKAAQSLGALQRRLPSSIASPSLSTSASSGIPAGPVSMDACRDPLEACLMEDDEGSKKGSRPCDRGHPIPADLPAQVRPDVANQKKKAPSRGEVPPAGEYCAVCHDDYTLPCQANCGHWFCAECIMRVWHHGSALSPCRCPICRRTVTLLLPCDITNPPTPAQSASSVLSTTSSGSSDASCAAPVAAIGAARKLQLQQDVAKYNRLFGGTPVSLWQRILDMPVLLQRMGRDLVNPTRALNLLHNVRFVVCTACVGMYVISPFDIIPEGLVGVLGFLDDIVFLLCVAFYLTVLYRALLVNRASSWPRNGQASGEESVATFGDSTLN